MDLFCLLLFQGMGGGGTLRDVSLLRNGNFILFVLQSVQKGKNR